MDIKKLASSTLLATSLASAPALAADPNNTKPVTLKTFNGKTAAQVCANYKNETRMIMDRSENALVACHNGKPAIPQILRVTYNPKITPVKGTYKIDKFDDDKVNHKGVAMPYAMHVDLPHTKYNALWVHEGRIWMPNGKLRVSNGCVGVHHKYSQALFNVMK